MFFLKTKDIIDIIAPARADPLINISKCLEFIESWGYTARLHPDTFGDDFFYAHSDQGRLNALEKSVYSPDSKALWCLRGGYGTTRVLSHLSLNAPIPPHKVLIGLSDCTALLLYAFKKWSWTCIHGPVLCRMAHQNYSPETYTSLKHLLDGSLKTLTHQRVLPLNRSASVILQENITLSGEAIGGNLCLLQSSINTPWVPETKAKILFIEDVNESSYRTLERIHHLKTAGLLNNITALILFDFHEDLQKEEEIDIEAYRRIGMDLELIPVFKSTGVGHGSICLPIVFGEKIKIKNQFITQVINK